MSPSEFRKRRRIELLSIISIYLTFIIQYLSILFLLFKVGSLLIFDSYGRLVRCDIPAPRTAASRLFAFVEYESRRDADDAYHEMHNKRIGRYDEILKIEWARTPPSASWRFDTGRERDRPTGRRSSPRRGGRTPSPRRSRGDYSPRKDDRDRDSRRDRDREYEHRPRGDRSRSPNDREREIKEERDRDREEGRENGTNGEDRKVAIDSPPAQTHDELDTAE